MTTDTQNRVVCIQDFSLILEPKDFSEQSTTSSTFVGSRHPSIDLMLGGHLPA